MHPDDDYYTAGPKRFQQKRQTRIKEYFLVRLFTFQARERHGPPAERSEHLKTLFLTSYEKGAECIYFLRKHLFFSFLFFSSIHAQAMASYTPSSSRPHTPLGLSPRGSYTNLASAAYDASSPGGHGAKDEKERLRAEREVQEALLKAQDGVEKAKKEEVCMPASTTGE